jgi:hypothetical protein
MRIWDLGDVILAHEIMLAVLALRQGINTNFRIVDKGLPRLLPDPPESDTSSSGCYFLP